MKFQIEAVEIDDGWQVGVTNVSTGEVLLDPENGEPISRILKKRVEGVLAFPLPPEEEAARIAPDAPHRELCLPQDDFTLSDAYTAVLGQDVAQGGVERFGRYLFATLLGESLWVQMDQTAGANPVELALTWPGDDLVLNRLPWETMYYEIDSPGGIRGGFLAAEPQISITRRVRGGSADVGNIESPPRVLFVVGTELTKDVIRPGAEYLGLLRSLEEDGLYLTTRIALEASTESLQEAVKEFKPTVVHFICHGLVESGKAYLELMDKDSKASVTVNAETLLSVLHTDENLPLPQVVVLNACSTATADELEVGRPMAAEFVEGGIPIVVGMSGRVSDQACRLFTKGFYKSLLKGGEIASAAADGRRAAIRHSGYDARSTVDWALPTLFLSEAVKEPRVNLTNVPAMKDRQAVAMNFSPPDFPPFCGRFNLFQLYDRLMAGEHAQSRMPGRRTPIQVVAVSVKQPDNPDPKTSSPKYGRTWLLKEMAAQAVRDGHVPILVTKEALGSLDYPKTLRELLDNVFFWAANTTVQIFKNTQQHEQLDWQWDYLPRLLALKQNDALPDDFPADIKQFYRGNPEDPRIIAVAFRLDLLRLLDAVRAQRPEAERGQVRLLLLIDDVHQMGPAAEDLVKHLLGQFGVHSAADKIRVVFSYSETPIEGQNEAIKAITDWVRSPWVYLETLKKFHNEVDENKPDEYIKAFLVYKHFLLYWKVGNQPRPLTLARSDNDKFVRSFFKAMAEQVEGIPSYLEDRAKATIDVYLGLPVEVLRDADDEDALQDIQNLKRS